MNGHILTQAESVSTQPGLALPPQAGALLGSVSTPPSYPCCRSIACFLVPFLWYPMRPLSKTCGMGLVLLRG